MKKLFLVDAYALIFKYYYAFMGRPMRNRAGMNTSVVFGFTKFLRDIQKREHPDLLGVAFDPKGGSFRREIFPEYKANRAETPEISCCRCLMSSGSSRRCVFRCWRCPVTRPTM